MSCLVQVPLGANQLHTTPMGQLSNRMIHLVPHDTNYWYELSNAGANC